MGRPGSAKVWGDTSEPGLQLRLWGNVGNGNEWLYVTKQTGVRRFEVVAEADSTRTGVVFLKESVDGVGDAALMCYPYSDDVDVDLEAVLEIDNISLTNPGSGIETADIDSPINVEGGTGTAATVTIDTATVIDFDINAAGTGYIVDEVITAVGGTGDAATFRVTEIGASGEVEALELIDGGAYTVTSATFTTTSSEDGENLTLEAVDYGILDFTLTTQGEYTAIPGTTVTLDGITGATFEVDYDIESVTVADGGAGFLTFPRIFVSPESVRDHITFDGTVDGTGTITAVTADVNTPLTTDITLSVLADSEEHVRDVHTNVVTTFEGNRYSWSRFTDASAPGECDLWKT